MSVSLPANDETPVPAASPEASVSPRTRRAILVGAIGGVAGLAAGVLGRPLPVSAANGDAVKVGKSHTGSNTTFISSSDTPAFRARTTTNSGNATGIQGETADSNGNGVVGMATASSGTPAGVRGQTNAPSGAGVYGVGPGRGVSGTSTGTAGRGALGVATATTGDARGVHGQSASTAGIGVSGHVSATTGSTIGVLGTASSETGIGVKGRASRTTSVNVGVYGESEGDGGFGVYGRAYHPNGIGIRGFGRDGVSGISQDVDGNGVSAYSFEGTGARGESVRATGGIGVHGVSAGATQGTGVRGTDGSSTGVGVRGTSTGDDGTGVWGSATHGTGVGVAGTATGAYGVAGSFEVPTDDFAIALRVTGRADFSTAGVSTIQSGSSSVVVSPGVNITNTAKVLATLQGNAGGATTVARVVRDTGDNTITIHLTANATSDVDVAWFVIG